MHYFVGIFFYRFKRFENFEQDQENAWNCSRQISSNSSYPNYNMNLCVMSPDENMHDEMLVGKNMDTVSLSLLLMQFIFYETCGRACFGEVK